MPRVCLLLVTVKSAQSLTTAQLKAALLTVAW
jgi:hypothetical protein